MQVYGSLIFCTCTHLVSVLLDPRYAPRIPISFGPSHYQSIRQACTRVEEVWHAAASPWGRLVHLPLAWKMGQQYKQLRVSYLLITMIDMAYVYTYLAEKPQARRQDADSWKALLSTWILGGLLHGVHVIHRQMASLHRRWIQAHPPEAQHEELY
jgi:hypothetical protein